MFHHQNSRSSKHRRLSVSSDKFTTLNRIPTLFGRNLLFNSGLSTIASKWRSSMRKQEPQRIDVTLDGLECLQSIFDTCVTSAIEDPPFVNLRTFLQEVSSSRFLLDTLGSVRAQVVSSEIFRLDNPGSHNQFVSWFKLRELLESQTLLNFPITCESMTQFNEYKQLLTRNGIPSMPIRTIILPIPTIEDDVPLNSVSHRYKELSINLEKQHSVLYKLEERSLVEERIELMMETKEPEQVDTEEDRIANLRSMRFTLLEVEDIVRVKNILQGSGNDDVVIEKFNIPVTKNKMMCLRPSTWLNDEIINFYMCLLKERDTELCAVNPSRLASYFFNSFFIFTLMIRDNGYNYKSVRRWTKNVDVFTLDKIFFPVNLSNTHWTMLVIYMAKKEIHYYDSMSGDGRKYLEGMKKWLVDEYMDKKKGEFNIDNWVFKDREKNIPQQQNGVDCGMFSIVCADFLSDNLPLDYSQQDMPFFRKKIAAAVINGSLPYDTTTE